MRPLTLCPSERTRRVPGSGKAGRAIGTTLTTDTLPPADERHTFADLGVIEPISEALKLIGIEHPFPIQSLSIPIAIQGTDMIGQARTGTGKTLAFGVSLLQRIVVQSDPGYADLEAPGAPQALVMCPTRELALQVTRDLEVASTIRKVRILTVYGGVGYDTQLDTLSDGVDVVVGTPGRLLDLLQRRNLNLGHVKVLVLDEADEMLDLGFLPDVEKLIARTPKTRQTLLFSATMPSAIVALSRMHLNQPINVRAEAHDESATVPLTHQHVFQVHDLDKPEIVGRILQAPNCTRTMIFTRTKRAAQRITDDLNDRGFNAESIHGDLSQVAREKALTKFREGKADILVATDVAARGIDVADVTHVINYECPDDDKAYVHRIGRTGRAGAQGIAITFVDWADITRWHVINNTLDLGFHEPPETYSTSDSLYEELEIPVGTKGRIKEAAPRPPREDRPDRGDRERPRQPRQPSDRNRSRRRLRDGAPVTEGESVSAVAEVAAPAEPTPSGEERTGAPRRRRRRGGSSRGNSDAPA